MFSRARRLSSLSTTYHGDSAISVWTNISSLAREYSSQRVNDSRSMGETFQGRVAPLEDHHEPGALGAHPLLEFHQLGLEPVELTLVQRPRQGAAAAVVRSFRARFFRHATTVRTNAGHSSDGGAERGSPRGRRE